MATTEIKRGQQTEGGLPVSEVAGIIKTTYDVLTNSQDVPVQLDSNNLGMAYAVPKGLEATAAATYSPWTENSVDNTFHANSSVFGETLVDIWMTLSWKTHEAQQYIINANLDKQVNYIDPTTSVSIKVRFDQPTLYDVEWEAYEISYNIELTYDPVGGFSTVRYAGSLRADGTGTFRQL